MSPAPASKRRRGWGCHMDIADRGPSPGLDTRPRPANRPRSIPGDQGSTGASAQARCRDVIFASLPAASCRRLLDPTPARRRGIETPPEHNSQNGAILIPMTTETSILRFYDLRDDGRSIDTSFFAISPAPASNWRRGRGCCMDIAGRIPGPELGGKNRPRSIPARDI